VQPSIAPRFAGLAIPAAHQQPGFPLRLCNACDACSPVICRKYPAAHFCDEPLHPIRPCKYVNFSGGVGQILMHETASRQRGHVAKSISLFHSIT
jgi:hypothetical protein